ncbi:MAG: cytochrome c biogenesis protein CcsA [Phycisphaerae bacterium]|jgi:heme exporter protein C|nr:cytochrome c biogenesis protein CcsA [Phycisphaerae bacterium]
MTLPLIILDFVLMTAAFVMIFFYAPIDAVMGPTQKIFYIHLPGALASFFSTFILFLASLKYLVKPSPQVDRLAWAAADTAWLFCTLTLITGMLWARQAWMVWWTWDPRLTSFLVLWCVLSLYHVLRRSLPPGSLQSRLAAVFGLIGFLDVPLVFLCIYWWQSLHPAVITSREIRIDISMFHTLIIAVLAVLGLAILLIHLRVKLLTMESRLSELIRIAGDTQDLSDGRKK